MLVRTTENSARIRSVSFKCAMSTPFFQFACTTAVFLPFKNPLLEIRCLIQMFL